MRCEMVHEQRARSTWDFWKLSLWWKAFVVRLKCFPVHHKFKLFTIFSLKFYSHHIFMLFTKTSDSSSLHVSHSLPFHFSCIHCTSRRKWFTRGKKFPAVSHSTSENLGLAFFFIFSHRHHGRFNIQFSLLRNFHLSDFCHSQICFRLNNRTNKCAFKSCDVSVCGSHANFREFFRVRQESGEANIEIENIFVLCRIKSTFHRGDFSSLGRVYFGIKVVIRGRFRIFAICCCLLQKIIEFFLLLCNVFSCFQSQRKGGEIRQTQLFSFCVHKFSLVIHPARQSS